MKIFTLEEAQTLLPILEALLDRGTAAAETALRLEEKFAELRVRIFHLGGVSLDPAVLARWRGDLEKCKVDAAESFRELDSLGVHSRSPGLGRLDLPCTFAGEMKMLCWERGETAIHAWHGAEESCEKRRPVDARFLKAAAGRRTKA